ncbi:MAG: energy-coupling factor ABC transporter ATP-binding protein [[Pasteurella] mairii]|uniref:Cell division ATP-binding protein FtsE n=1 Tax=[Pasteurella] mairii TaxID=757 RepID=A0A379B4Y7_9PAST|nr:energy-coupling factor ABC transporter ATP-binding protein [[Pasteurella] mairii]SUB33606.1 cell division ATP-binding protein FtsE [[Pasteurella] mairii]
MVLAVHNLHIHLQHQPIIQGVSFHLQPQQRLFLQGDIGAGKSTLLHSLLGFVPISQGEIYWFGQCCRQEKDFQLIRGAQVGICFQQAEDQLFGPTVLDDVAFGLLNLGVSRERAYQQALTQLEQLDIAHLKARSVNWLSGGEKNFVALAGVLVMRPKVLLLDEPTNNLAQKNIEKLTALLRSLRLPMLIASHDQGFVQALADDCLLLKNA